MKRQYLLGYLSASLLLFFSCLADEGQKVAISSQAAVLEMEPDRVMHVAGKQFGNEVNITKIYSSKLESISGENGDCYIVDFVIDFDKDENKKIADSDLQAYTVDDLTYTAVPQFNAVSKNQLDTGEVKTNENKEVIEVLLNSIQNRHEYIQDMLFVYGVHSVHDSLGLQLTYDLSYLPNQNIQDDKSFELYLRVMAEEKSSSTYILKSPDVSAFNMANFVNTFAGQTPDDTLRIKIKYAKSFNADTTKISTWQDDLIKLVLIR